MKKVIALTRKVIGSGGGIVTFLILFFVFCSSHLIQAQCTCDVTIGTNPPSNITLTPGVTTCIGSGVNLQNSEVTGPGTICIAPGQNVGTIKKIGNDVIVNNYGSLTINDLDASAGNTNTVNNLGAGILNINEVNTAGLSTVNGVVVFNNVKGTGTLVINDNTTINNFQGVGTVDLFGVTNINGMTGSNGQILNNNRGARTLIDGYNANGETQFNNFEGAYLKFDVSSLNLNNSDVFNEDTIIFEGGLNSSTGSQIINNGWIYVTDASFNPGGTIVNNGWLRGEKFLNINGGPITNNCWFITDQSFNNNAGADFINNGGIWVDSPTDTWANNGSSIIKLGPESVIYSRGDFTNQGSIILVDQTMPGGDFYVAQESVNQGVFGAPGDVFNFFDNTGTNFDTENTAPAPGITFNAIPEPDTTSFASTCNARITSDDPPTIDLDENDVTTTGTGYKGTYTEGDGNVTIDEITNITDDSDSLVSATVELTNPLDGTLEFLNVGGVAGMSSSPDPNSNGTLWTITPNGGATKASVASFEAVINSFIYRNTSENPTETDRIITVTVTNPIGRTASANSVICMVAINDDPIAIDDAMIVPEGGTQDTLTVLSGANSVLANDTDPENDGLIVLQVLDDVDHGILTLSPTGDGTFTYVHDGSETTSDFFTYIVSDGNGGVDTATVTITVVPVNDLPIGAKDSLIVAEGGTQTVLMHNGATNSVLTNDTDAEGTGTLTATLVTTTTNGSLTFSPTGDGTFTYEHDGGESSTDFFTYRLNDGTDDAASLVTVCIIITRVNDVPVGVKDSLNVNEGGTQTILVTGPGNTSVLDNDTDEDNITLNATLQDSVKNGTIDLLSNGTFTYIHDGSETLVDSFTYVVNDGTEDGNTITVCISINPINDIPVAFPDTIIVNEGGTQTILANGPGNTSVLDNDTDADLVFDLDAIKLSDPNHASNFTFNEQDGTFSYTHDGSETTSDGFTYRVNDGTVNGNTVPVVIIIIPVNDDPVAVNDTNRLCEGDVSVTHAGPESSGTIIFNDTDVDGDPREVVSVEGQLSPSSFEGTYGTLEWEADGTYTYTLNLTTTEPLKEGEIVEDVFDYIVTDNITGTDNAQIVIIITGKNDAINAVDDDNALSEGDSPVDETDGNGPLIDNDIDPDDDTKTITSISSDNISDNTGEIDGTYGTLDWDDDGTYIYTLNNDAVDSLQVGEIVIETFTYTVTDGNQSVTADLVITITGTNDAPIAVDDENSMNESSDFITHANVTSSGTLLQNDRDPDGPNADVLVVESVEGTLTIDNLLVTGTFGTLEWEDDGTYTYNLDESNPLVSGLGANETLVDTFNYVINDGNGLTDNANLIITIFGGNAAPNATADENELCEDEASISNTVGLFDATGPLLENDTDIDASDILTVITVNEGPAKSTNGLYGILEWQDNGTYIYKLDTNLIAVQALALGETLTDTFRYVISDGNVPAGTDNSILVITINGKNDVPVANPDFNSMTEGDGQITDADAGPTGNLILDNTDDTDIDATDILTISEIEDVVTSATSEFVGTYGTLTWLSNGSYIYTENDVATQPLDEGEVVTDVFIYTVTDGIATDTSTLTITITGVNDAPVALPDSIIVCEGEDTTLLVGGGADVRTNDSDNEGNSLTVTVVTDVTNGDLDLDPLGTFIYQHDSSETTTDFFTYVIFDGTLFGDTVRVDIRIIPKNDPPTAEPDSNKIVEGVFSIVESDGLTTKNILDNDNDVDLGSTLEVFSVEGSTDKITEGIYGRLEWQENGNYTYFLNNDAVDSLTQGELVFDVFNYVNIDNEGATAPSTLKICISGVNDEPIAVNDTNSICEGEASIAHTTGGGTLVDNDIDGDFDVRLVTEIDGIPTSTTSTLAEVSGTYGTLTWDEDGNYTYTLNNDAVDSLQLDEEVFETFTYTITDGLALDSADLEIRIIGKNDNPIARNDTNSLTEVTDLVRHDGPNGTGTLLDGAVNTIDTDIDGDVLMVERIDGIVNDTIIGDYGLLIWSNIDGSYTYNLDNDLGVVDSLAIGEVLVDSFLYVINDGNLGLDSAYLYIFINGTNEAPRAFDDAHEIHEDTVSVTGNIKTNDQDLDASDILTIVSVNGELTDSVATNYGSIKWNLDGTYTYYLNNEDTVNIQSLSEDQRSIIDTISYTVSDGNLTDMAQLIIQVIGVNDRPKAENDSITISDQTDIYEENDPNNGLLANDTDIDQLDNLVVEGVGNDLSSPSPGGTVPGGYGVLTWFADGTYRYDLENSNSEVVALAEGEFLRDTFNYNAFDSYPDGRDNALFIVIISGGNQTPTAVSDTLCIEEGADPTEGLNTLRENDIDPDASNVLTIVSVNGDEIGMFNSQFGSLVWDSEGKYTYTLNNSLDTIISLGIGDTISEMFPYRVTDGVDTVESFLLIRIKGINNDPIANPDALTITECDGPTNGTESLLQNDSDPDLTDTLVVIEIEGQTDVADTVQGKFGKLIWDSEGNYTYILDTSLTEIRALNNGESETDEFDYTISDEHNLTDASTLTITINGKNNNPVIVDTIGGTAIDTICITMDELTTNDTTLYADDVDDSQTVLSWNIITEDTENPEIGTATIVSSTGILTYETDVNFTEDTGDTLTVRVCDNGNGCDTVVVIYKILDVNDPPVATNLKVTTDYEMAVDIDVTAYVSDPDGFDDLDFSTITVIGGPSNGRIDEIDPITGVITYIPDEGFSGDDSFEYTIQDKSGETSTVGTVTICVGDRPPFVVGGGVTPNGDGKNDYLHIENIEFYPNTSVQIFNRWGNLVWQQDCCYDNNDPEKRWNGESNVGAGSGGPVPDGSYYFVVDGSADGVNPCTGYAIKN